MNDPDDFLTRWSRRKRAVAAAEKAALEKQARAPTDDAQEPVERSGQRSEAPITRSLHAGAEAEKVEALPTEAKPTEAKTKEQQDALPVFDISTLPSIESITADTDIRGFLAPGVPAELRVAALRRAWAADPKVRDFVGLADYDFDYNTPGAIAGFGPLGLTDEMRREMARLMTGWPVPAESPPAGPAQPIPEVSAPLTAEASPDHRLTTSEQAACNQDELITNEAKAPSDEESAAVQQDQSQSEQSMTPARRGHGGALPH
jgi:hypothetical protein